MNTQTTITDPFCQCGYRESAHLDGDQSCPLRGGYENLDGKKVYRPSQNPGVTFSRCDGYNR